jgi:hypothetical protein
LTGAGRGRGTGKMTQPPSMAVRPMMIVIFRIAVLLRCSFESPRYKWHPTAALLRTEGLYAAARRASGGAVIRLVGQPFTKVLLNPRKLLLPRDDRIEKVAKMPYP